MLQSLRKLVQRLNQWGKARVLVVSDKLFVSRFLADRLDSVPGVLLVGRPKDAQDASFFLREVGADVVILDLEMNIDGGLIWLETLQPHERRRCIVFSSLPEEDPYVMVGMGLGAGAYVFNSGETSDAGLMLQHLQQAIQRVRQSPSAAPKPLRAVGKLQPA